MRLTAIVQGERVDIDLIHSGADSIEVTVGGRKYSLESRAVEPGVFWLNWNNRSIEVLVTQNADTYDVSIDGRRIPVEIVDARTALRRAGHHGHDGVAEIRAPMPGKIVRVLVREGTEVQAHQGILVMEAMKMQNEIKSPKKGIVQRLGVTEGAAVSSGYVLAVVE